MDVSRAERRAKQAQLWQDFFATGVETPAAAAIQLLVADALIRSLESDQGEYWIGTREVLLSRMHEYVGKLREVLRVQGTGRCDE